MSGVMKRDGWTQRINTQECAGKVLKFLRHAGSAGGTAHIGNIYHKLKKPHRMGFFLFYGSPGIVKSN
ncbi:MAG: hypothetical protein KGN01_04360 [Patescibacteria group bacterium]|nr:hypothetical protein [Patescibacteria group bacterium]